jgi:hypothetical protein
MPELKQLSEGEKPADASKYLMVERFCEPAMGMQYRISGQGCCLFGEYTHRDLKETCDRALCLAEKSNIQVVYLSCNCSPAGAKDYAPPPSPGRRRVKARGQ